jgi:hypothetical protein
MAIGKEIGEHLKDLMRRDGWWPCKYCSVDGWEINHREDELLCPKTGIPREGAELEESERK